MSRFIDALNRAAKETPPPMGFRTNRAAPAGPRLHLVAALGGAEAAVKPALEGADAVLLRPAASLTARALQKTASGLPDMPWGVWLEDAGNKKGVEAVVAAGADFIIFPEASRVTAVSPDDKTGRIMKIDAALGDSYVRALNDLPLSAVLAAASEGATSWRHLVLYRRLANLLDKPLLAEVTSAISEEELRMLWEAGVDGVVVDIAAGAPGSFEELRRAVEKFPPRARKQGKAEAILPRLSLGAAPPEEEEEDE